MTVDKKTTRFLTRDGGFTFVELLFAMFILMVAILANAMFMMTTIKTNANSRKYTVAASLAQDKLEDLASRSFSDTALSDVNTINNSSAGILKTTTADTDYQEVGIDEKGSAGGIYTRTLNIWDVSATRKDIVVIVHWQENSGAMKMVRFSTLKSI